jgi:hypothetical protein
MRSWRSAAFLAVVTASSGVYACSGSNAASPAPPADDASPGDGGAAAETSVSSIPGRACPDQSPLSYQSFGQPFFASWCTGCHSSALGTDLRRGAPADINFDTLASIREKLPLIYAQAGDDHATMPPAGGPPQDLRHQLGDWLACGAPGDEVNFDAKPSDAGVTLPTGPCAQKRDPLPPSSLPRCAAATYACLKACQSTGGPNADACSKQCKANDPTPADPVTGANCDGCLSTQTLACADRACHGPLAEYLCCALDAGASNCNAEEVDFSYCVYYASPSCVYLEGPDQAACFPADAGIDGGY